MRTPNFFLAGTTKGGTSTLHLWLSQHPDIYLAPQKELHYFCECPAKLRAADGWDGYCAVFGEGGQPIVGEASPCYIYYPGLPEKLRELVPNARVLLSLRDPVERFWSHYLMNRTYRQDYPDPAEIIDNWELQPPQLATDDLVGMGMYGVQYLRWTRSFSEAAIRVVFLEEMTTHPEDLLEGIFAFLGVRPHHIDTTARDKTYVEGRNTIAHYLLRNRTARRLGVAVFGSRARRFLKYRVLGRSDLRPEIPQTVATKLRVIYRADSLLLEQLLGRQLPWSWHRSA